MKISTLKYLISFVLFFLVFINVEAQYHAIYIPIERVNNMEMDGHSSDWSWVPEKYIIRTNNMGRAMGNRVPNEKNFNCELIVGWNDMTNWIYIIAIIQDDKTIAKLGSEYFYLNDCFEIAFGSSYISSDDDNLFNNYVLRAHYIKSSENYSNELKFDIGPDWMITNKFVKTGCSRNNNETIYEIGMSLWDYWDKKGYLFSKRCYLKPDKRIRLTITIDDLDNDENVSAYHPDNNNENILSGQWITNSGPFWRIKSGELSAFILDPPINSKISWSNVETIIKFKE